MSKCGKGGGFGTCLCAVTGRLYVSRDEGIRFCPLRSRRGVIRRCGSVIQLRSETRVDCFLGFLSSRRERTIVLHFKRRLDFKTVTGIVKYGVQATRDEIHGTLGVVEGRRRGREWGFRKLFATVFEEKDATWGVEKGSWTLR